MANVSASSLTYESFICRRAFEVASFLYENGIAHNLFMCRHEPFTAMDDGQESIVRIFIFPKLSAPGSVYCFLLCLAIHL